ncbi:MAG: fibronectin type III domain-containing protein [Minicystis sp.]
MDTLSHNPIALNLPRSAALLILFARHVVQAMNGNPWFPTPTPPLATVTANVDALEVAEATARSRAKGTAAARDLNRKVVEADLMALKAYVQAVANQEPEKAAAIIQSAGMAPKRASSRAKPFLAAAMGTAAGEVILRAKAARGRVAYHWEVSSDGGRSWTSAGTTTVANTTVQGLAMSTTYLFRVRTTIARATGDWSQSIAFTVH